jgi:glutamate-1-semialdehyde 2,1-aminomutase
MSGHFTFTDLDGRIVEEIQARLPERMFDFHAHLYRLADLHAPEGDWMTQGPELATHSVWYEHIGRQMGMDRLKNGLFFPMVSPDCDIDRANEFLIEQVRDAPGSRGLILISPLTPEKTAVKWLNNPRIAGFKPYPFFSTFEPKFQSAPSGFIPDWAWELAQELGLMLTVHLVKDGAIADPENFGYVAEKCRNYPNARLVLAHCGRGFYAPNARKGIPMLRGLANVWFDTSAICEPGPIVSVLREFGPGRLLWGSDFPDSEIRGRCVTVGDSFFWIQPERLAGDSTSSGLRATLVGIESVRGILEAADYCSLTPSEVQDIFYRNAVRMLGLREDDK